LVSELQDRIWILQKKKYIFSLFIMTRPTKNSNQQNDVSLPSTSVEQQLTSIQIVLQGISSRMASQDVRFDTHDIQFLDPQTTQQQL
jgi:hypothetical protein